MKNILKFLGVFTSCIIVFIFLHLTKNIGISKSNIESNARTTQSIPTNWEVCKDEANTMAATLFYDKNSDNHTFSIYATREHPTLGYFFRAGGSLGVILDEVVEFRIKGHDERIFMSMNKKQVSKLSINNGDTIETIDVDSTEPFTLILPLKDCAVTIYDINDNILYSTVQQL